MAEFLQAFMCDLKTLDDHYEEILKYMIHTSDSLTLIMHMVKPYSKKPNPCKEIAFSKPLEPFLIDQELGCTSWPMTPKIHGYNHYALCRYRCDRLLRYELLKLPSLFNYIPGSMPQDLCLYRNGLCWFAETSHEGFASFLRPTTEDVRFVQSLIDGAK